MPRERSLFPAFAGNPAGLLNSDSTAGAGINASTAAHAGIFNDHSLVAFEFDSFGGAGIHTGTATGAGIFVNFSSHFLFLLIVFEGYYNIMPSGTFVKSYLPEFSFTGTFWLQILLS